MTTRIIGGTTIHYYTDKDPPTPHSPIGKEVIMDPRVHGVHCNGYCATCHIGQFASVSHPLRDRIQHIRTTYTTCNLSICQSVAIMLLQASHIYKR